MTPHTDACAREVSAAAPIRADSARAQAQALRWVMDDLLDAEVDLVALLASPTGMPAAQRERLREFCTRIAAALG
jgi:type IV pilus biogenesis protein CpaD/CtpE